MKVQKILTTTRAVEIITCYLQENYDADYNNRYATYYYFLLYKMWTLCSTIDTKDGFVNIGTTLFTKWININYKGIRLVNMIKRDLETMGLIECDNYYYKTKFKNGTTKSKTLGYRLCEKFFNNTTIHILDFKAHAKINKQIEILPAYKRHLKDLRTLKIDYAACVDFIQQKLDEGDYMIKPKNDKARVLTEEIAKTWILHAFNLKNRYFYFYKGKKVDRVYNNLSNFPSRLKQFLFFNRPVKCAVTDVVNSQPLLINIMMAKSGVTDAAFKADCEQGVFYDRLMKLTHKDRDTTKTKVYTNILFGVHRDGTVLMDAFKELYPVAYHFVKEQKSDNDAVEVYNEEAGDYQIEYSGDGNSCFAINLQNIESELILGVANKLHNLDKHCLTIHDALFFEADNAEYVEEEIMKAFAAYDIKPKLKTE